MTEITSIKNNKIKELRKLYKKKYRKRQAQFVLEGLRLIRGAYRADAGIEDIFLTKKFYGNHKDEKFIIDNQNKLLFVNSKLIYEVADTDNPQNIIAVVNEPQTEAKEVLAKDYILVIDQIQDPGNMGTLIRTAAAAGFESMIISKGSVDIYNLKVLRSTAGAIYSIPFIKDIAKEELKTLLKEKEQHIYAADLDTDHYYNKLDYKKPLSLIIGNEAVGIRKELLEIADKSVKIPLRGNVESLNAAIAAGIIMFRILEK